MSIRMNDAHRSFLFSLAGQNVKCPAEEKAEAAAYDKASPLVRKIVEEKFPPKDMRLLVKYDCAAPDSCIKLQLTAGGITQFNFRDVKDAPLLPNGYECRSRIFASDATVSAAVGAHELACGALKKARAKIMDDYRALIWSTPTLEQIEAVWPEAKALRERLNKTLPVRLSQDVINRIRADVATRAKAA
jgi:hypothetical protein